MASPTANSVPTTEINLANLAAQSDEIRALVDSWGYKWGSGGQGTGVTLTYSFIKSTSVFYDLYSDFDGVGGDPGTDEQLSKVALTAAEQTAVTDALQGWAHVANVKFNLVNETSTTVGEFRAGTSDVVQNLGNAGWAYLPTDFPEGGDLWLADGDNFNADGGAVPKGTYDYSTILHELGHALGLQHPHDDGGIDEVSLVGDPNTALNLDLMLMSVMSYQYGFGFMAGFEPTTPMVLDIAAIQYLYGPNWSYNAGPTTYNFSATGQYHETIWDGSGTDTIVYTGSAGGVINLNGGAASELGVPVQFFNLITFAIGEDPRTVWIAENAKIENAKGGSGSDEIIGNSLINNLQGNGGHDTIFGNNGNDILYGQGGNDVLNGGIGVDQMFGGGGNDSLDGGAGQDSMKGGPGNDTYFINVGGETITELVGEGTDTIQSPRSLTLPDNVENLRLTGADSTTGTGNALNNVLIGGAGNNSLFGMNGTDRLDGGAGNDLLKGGAHADTFVFNDPIGATNVDTAGDFKPGLDKIELDDDIYTMLGVGTLLDANFTRNAFGDPGSPNHFICYNTSTGALFYDADGNGGGFIKVQIGIVLDSLGDPAVLDAGNFIVVT